jgi:hypothetical protein
MQPIIDNRVISKMALARDDSTGTANLALGFGIERTV